VNGRKRHIVVDTFGNLRYALVHPANIQDRDGAKLVLDGFPDEQLDRLDVLWADWMEDAFTTWRLSLVTR